MIKAVLFDLDDTLLRLNLTAFLGRYANGVSGLLSRAARVNRLRVAEAIGEGWLAAEGERRRDHMTNAELMDQIMLKRCGIRMDEPCIRELVDYYEAEFVPGLGGGIVRAEPMPGAHAAVDACWDAGLTCALATNPVLSLACDRARLGWAGFDETEFALISTAQNSTRAKPWAEYYTEFCGKLGFLPEECLMVGNDAKRDFPHPECGVRTVYVGHAKPTRAVWSGHMRDLAGALPRILDACAD